MNREVMSQMWQAGLEIPMTSRRIRRLAPFVRFPQRHPLSKCSLAKGTEPPKLAG